MDVEKLKEARRLLGKMNPLDGSDWADALDIAERATDDAIASQSVTSEEVAEAIKNLTTLSKMWEEIGQPTKEIDLAITALQAYQPWIPVSERLPEREEHYLCCEMNYQAIFVAHYGTSGWQRPLYRETAVTHWMPLPEPPKGE